MAAAFVLLAAGATLASVAIPCLPTSGEGVSVTIDGVTYRAGCNPVPRKGHVLPLEDGDGFLTPFDARKPPAVGPCDSLSFTGPSGRTTLRLRGKAGASSFPAAGYGSSADSPIRFAPVPSRDGKETAHALLDKRTGEVLEISLPAR